MNLISSLNTEKTALQRQLKILEEFDIPSFQANIILLLPLNILIDFDLTDRIIKLETELKIKELFDLVMKSKQKGNE